MCDNMPVFAPFISLHVCTSRTHASDPYVSNEQHADLYSLSFSFSDSSSAVQICRSLPALATAIAMLVLHWASGRHLLERGYQGTRKSSSPQSPVWPSQNTFSRSSCRSSSFSFSISCRACRWAHFFPHWVFRKQFPFRPGYVSLEVPWSFILFADSPAHPVARVVILVRIEVKRARCIVYRCCPRTHLLLHGSRLRVSFVLIRSQVSSSESGYPSHFTLCIIQLDYVVFCQRHPRSWTLRTFPPLYSNRSCTTTCGCAFLVSF